MKLFRLPALLMSVGLAVVGLAVLALALGARPTPAQAAAAGFGPCSATPDNGTTVFSGSGSQAVRDAVAAAPAGGIVKLAGLCTGVQAQGGTTQTVLITKSLTLAGGFTLTNWVTAYPLTQPTTLDAQRGGRVISAVANLILRDFIVTGGQITNTFGGGLASSANVSLTRMNFISNVVGGSTGTRDGAGVFLTGNATSQFEDTNFLSNTNTNGNGGGLRNNQNNFVVIGGLFQGNQTAGNGGGAHTFGTTTFSGTVFLSNTAAADGGGAVFGLTTNATNVVFIGNRATSGGGVQQLNNTGRYVNSLWARNTATSGRGAAILVNDGSNTRVEVVHSTIASPTLAIGSAIFVLSDTVFITNTIIASHTVGISRTNGTANHNRSLFFGNTQHTAGGVTGSDSLEGDPHFVAPAADNYHIRGNSAALDLSPNAGVSVDVDGDPRPLGSGFDAGYDEALIQCFAEHTGDNTTDFQDVDAQAVRDAVAAASPGGTVKLAGLCTGVQELGGTTQTVLITKSLTLAGGFTPTNWATAYPVTQPTTLNALQGGRVISAVAALVLRDFIVMGGRVTNTFGGGLVATASLSLTRMSFIGNVTTGTTGTRDGAGVFVTGFTPPQIEDTDFLSNTVSGTNGNGGGLRVLTIAPALVLGGRFQGNQTVANGGGAHFGGNVIMSGTQFLSNTASAAGGGLVLVANATLTNVVFIGNWASRGGGVQQLNSTGRYVNSLWARNTATTGQGAAVFVNDGTNTRVEVVHSTIASPTVALGAAIFVVSDTALITNTIIASHTVGISRTNGTVSQDYNLFFGNTQNTAGAVGGGSNSLTGNPAFVAPATDNYHIWANSAAQDVGTDAGVNEDVDGDLRPLGNGFDLGYDEVAFWQLFLPYIVR